MPRCARRCVRPAARCGDARAARTSGRGGVGEARTAGRSRVPVAWSRRGRARRASLAPSHRQRHCNGPWTGRRRPSGARRDLDAVERDLDERAGRGHRLDVHAAPHGHDVAEDRQPFRLVGDDPRRRRQVGLDRALEMEREVRIGLEVVDPVAGPLARPAGDLDMAAEVVEHDLDPPRLPGAASRRRDVDRVPAAQGHPDAIVEVARAHIAPRPCAGQLPAAARIAAFLARLPAW